MGNNYIKKCPTCECDISYSKKSLLRQSIKRNSNCDLCFRKKISSLFKGKAKTSAHRKKLSESKQKYKEKYRLIMIELNHSKNHKPLSESHKKNLSLSKMGIKNPSKKKEVREKISRSVTKNYKNSTIHSTFAKSSQIKQYRETKIHYQGSYEFDFLENYYNLVKIENGKIFDYINSEGILKKYISDFYLPNYNCIIEIKSTFTYSKSRGASNNSLKKQSVLDKGYNFMFVIDKNYDFLDQYLKTN